MKFKTGEINIICSDLERSLVFYRDILGFTLIKQEGIACRLRCDNTHFLLLPVANSSRPREPYCSKPIISIDLLVDDIEKAYIYLKENNVAFEAEWKPGSSRFFIRDSDGLIIEIIESSE